MEWFAELWGWIRERETLFAWAGGLSLLVLVASAIAVPVLVRRIPDDYFLEEHPKTEAFRESRPVLRLVLLILKNAVGGILVIAGLLMLLTPGQGVLTILIGLMLMNFPGKRKLEIWLVRLKPLNRAINWIRQRAGRNPLRLPERGT